MRKAANTRTRLKARRNKQPRSSRAHAPATSRTPPIASAGHAGRVVARKSNPVIERFGSGVASARLAVARLCEAPSTCVGAISVAPEDREIVALLLAPFFILAVAIAGNQSLQIGKQLKSWIARPVPPVTLPASDTIARNTELQSLTPAARDARPTRHPEQTATLIARPALSAASVERPAQEARRTATAPILRATATDLRHFAAANAEAIAPPPAMRAARAPAAITGLRAALLQSPIATGREQVALITTNRSTVAAIPTPRDTLAIGVPAFPSLMAYDEQHGAGSRRVSPFDRCTLPTSASTAGAAHGNPMASTARLALSPATWFSTGTGASFGQRLAAAARRQLDEFVLYDAAYRSISYPRGDVPSLYGVCTDVVIRAYRDLGIDLQVAVQKARVGSGDRNIDHRRTETLRHFFQRTGQSLPVTTFAEDYLPGDIVTYARPQNTGSASRSHIAIVSDVVAPSGRPMIIHNRGWGPQLEDALFVDRITGHYRYTGAASNAPIGDVPPPAGPRRLLHRASAEPARSKKHLARTAGIVR